MRYLTTFVYCYLPFVLSLCTYIFYAITFTPTFCLSLLLNNILSIVILRYRHFHLNTFIQL